ncbi:hypothetical protein [Parasphingorhabdus sp.]|jgi:hypothetical protein|uniref:hypothetical protein n=1 Tax=Parasphingorhabdus sp. TaxID=2709688 RepID=UPI003D27D99B
MLKESLTFAVSIGFLIFFIAPTGDDEKPAAPIPPTAVAQPVTVAAEEEEDDSWGYEDEDEEEEEFNFGESMVGGDMEDFAFEDSGEIAEAMGDAGPPIQSAAAAQDTGYDRQVASSSVNQRNVNVTVTSPKPGQTGSIDNPISVLP